MPLLAERHGPDRVDPGRPGPLRLTNYEADRRLVVAHRIGVGHGAHGTEPASRGRHGAGSHGFLILLAGLPQVDVEVDQSWGHHLPSGIDDLGTVRPAQVRPHRGDRAILEQDIRRGVHLL